MAKLINIIKATGEIEPFAEKKVLASLIRAGADEELAERIVDQVRPQLYPNIPSFEIYDRVMKILKKEKRDLAERYNLKKAIMELGPSGYPFEKFIAAVLEANGYEVKTNQAVLGRCVSHEIDIVARESDKTNKTYMIECKFHNLAGGRTDIKAALYTYARFLDIKHKGFDIPWLVTNTKVTQDVKAYALCVGMEITSWDYPEENSLRHLVDESRLHPVTALTNLSATKKQDLVARGIIFCKDMECSRISVD
ncbi:MAG: restriction endonuclease [Patescibacteria group bacterium]|nr:restriction endonuclease [Patescibacteria group bacterium]